MSLSNVAADHALVSNILPDLSPQLRLDFEVLQRITTTFEPLSGVGFSH